MRTTPKKGMKMTRTSAGKVVKTREIDIESDTCVSDPQMRPPRQAAPTLMRATPVSAATPAPPSADSSLVSGRDTARMRRGEPQPLADLTCFASTPPSRGPGHGCGRARCQTPAEVCERWRLRSAARRVCNASNEHLGRITLPVYHRSH